MELASWRERTAQDENVPRGRVIKDEAIYEVAKHAPRSLDTLSRLRTVREMLRSRGDAILCAPLKPRSRAIPPMSPVPMPIPICPRRPPPPSSLLRVLLKAVSAELNIAPEAPGERGRP